LLEEANDHEPSFYQLANHFVLHTNVLLIMMV